MKLKILYITYDPETSNYCGIYRASIEYINSIQFLYNNINVIGINKFLNSNITKLNYDVVIIQTVLTDKVKNTIHKIKKSNNNIKIGLLVVYETENIPNSWKKFDYYTDFFITPTYLMKSILINNHFYKPIYVIQHNINHKLSSIYKKFNNNNNNKPYIFYTICKIDDPRKNIKNLIKCFLNTFSHKDNVLLYIKGYENNSIPKFVYNKNIHPKIKIDTLNISNSAIIDIHKNCNCYISLAHSEGVGLGMVEASTIGNPVLTTNYGGQLEYLNYGYFVDYKLDFININYSLFDKTQYWAYPNYNHASKLMKDIYNNQKDAFLIGQKNKKFIIENFNQFKIGHKFLNVINSL
jgi:hypothetical protein